MLQNSPSIPRSVEVYNTNNVIVKVTGKNGYNNFIVDRFEIRDNASSVAGGYTRGGTAYSIVIILPHGVIITKDTMVRIIINPTNIHGYIPVTEITIDGIIYTKSTGADDTVEQGWTPSVGGTKKRKRKTKRRRQTKKRRRTYKNK